MPWFYFKRRGEELCPVTPRKFPSRPRDANPANGDPLTPWYTYADHYDSEHVHVYSENSEEALTKARNLLSRREW